MKIKLACLAVILSALLLMVGCSAGDPLAEDFYFGEDVYIAGDLYVDGGVVNTDDMVTSTAVIVDNTVVRGDGGARGVQDSQATLSDAGNLYAPVVSAGNMVSTGKVEADRLWADIEGYSIDVVQASDSGIVFNDTLDLVFTFEPNIIVLDYTTRCEHDTTFQAGHTTGHSVIEVTAVDTISCDTSCTALFDDDGTVDSTFVQDSVASVIEAFGGCDAFDQAYFMGVGTWDTATHKLTITFSTVNNTDTTSNFVEIVATAYR